MKKTRNTAKKKLTFFLNNSLFRKEWPGSMQFQCTIQENLSGCANIERTLKVASKRSPHTHVYVCMCVYAAS